MPSFDVWAPAAERVELVLPEETVAMTRAGDRWTTDRAAADGQRYSYRVDGAGPFPDPRSRYQPEGPNGPSQIVDPTTFAWTDNAWQGVALETAVIYELHIGTFTADGTLDSAIERIDHLVDLGVTLVELMPVATFPGDRGWGYDGVDLYAVHAAYGGPQALARFVDACHAQGLGVCLDVVYNHLGPSGNYLSEFGPYFTDRHQTPWGAAVNLDAPGSDEVRRFIIDNALMWFRDYHLDALRLDAVHALVDERAVHMLEQLAAETDDLATSSGRPLTLIAESDRNDPATVTARADGGDGGFGLAGQWADDVHHTLHVLLTGESQGYYADFTDPGAFAKIGRTPFFHDGTWSSFRQRDHGRPVVPALTPGWKFVASLQTHDQVGNRATGERLSQLVGRSRLAAGATLLLTLPYTPMLFMGEEWGASTKWAYFTDHQEPELAEAVSEGRRREFAEHGWGDAVPDPQAASTAHDSTLRWDEVSQPEHARLLEWYRELLRLRRAVPALADPALGVTDVRRDGDVLTYARGGYTVVVNLSTAEIAHPLDGTSHLLAGWDAEAGDGVLTVAADGSAIYGPLMEE
ncbi:malto-oligosyltrehalose trehalohydrolase [Allobranchiibius sp. GilTou38]|uniref:malto-oligosyltrehalose trehalohydrolase n=1 Tax=Allobranchiibius sp. GilTou38 TaxID=2815210 RepID=UPI001AA18FBF|nr:malto-oligosyltrehalose trehalohydrolase [Allobranchiibius sp. GilTou38]MBO1767046.1 malto-oligosyltrehalose trehalohydrolase [Allobranchiibius sp. GilTou38]